MELASYAGDYTTSKLIEGGNYKQVLKNLDKRLKKSGDNVEALGLKAGVLLLLGDIERSRAICRSLINRKPAIVNQIHLELIFYTLCELQRIDAEIGDQELEGLWQNAIRTEQNPNNKAKLARAWVSQSIRQGDWHQLIKAAMATQRHVDPALPRPQHYWFCQTVARYLESRKVSDERMATMHKHLVSRMLEKAVSETSDKSEPAAKSGLCITTSRELNMFSEILFRECRYELIITSLEAPEILKIAGNDYFFDLRRGLCATKLEDTFRIWSWAKQTLENAKKRNQLWLLDDWRVWWSLIRISSLSVDKSTSSADLEHTKNALRATQTLLNECLSLLEYSHAPRRALLHYLSRIRRPNTVMPTQQDGSSPSFEASEVLQLCRDHFDLHFNRSYVFEDLKDKVERLSTCERLWLRNHMLSCLKRQVPSAEDEEQDRLTKARKQRQKQRWLMFETNLLHWDYELLQQSVHSKQSEQHPSLPSVIQKFVIASFGLHRLARKMVAYLSATEAKSGDGSCILGIKALELLSSRFEVKGVSFQAACVLHSLLTDSKSNFNARIMQIKLLAHHGLHLAAWESYKQLDVKEIIFEALCPLFFTRIAFTGLQASQNFDPRREMAKPLQFYETALSKIYKYEELAIESQNYAYMIHIEDLAHQIRNSPTRWLLGLERRRIARLRGLQYDRLDTSIDPLQCPKGLNFNHLSNLCRSYAEARLGRDGCSSYTSYLCYFDLISEALEGSVPLQRAKRVTDVLLKETFPERLQEDATLEKCESALILPLNALASLVATTENPLSWPNELFQKVQGLVEAMNSCWQDSDVQDWRRHCEKYVLPLNAFFNSCCNTLQFLQLCHRAAKKIITLATSKSSQDAESSWMHCLEGAHRIKEIVKSTSTGVQKMVEEARAQIPSKGRSVECLFDPETDGGGLNVKEAVLHLVGKSDTEVLLSNYCEESKAALDAVLRITIE